MPRLQVEGAVICWCILSRLEEWQGGHQLRTVCSNWVASESCGMLATMG